MDLPAHPDDSEKRQKGLLAGERGRGFAEILPDAPARLAKLKALIEHHREPQSRQRADKGKEANAMGRKTSAPINDDRLTPEEERQIGFGIAQGEAGLTYGPFEKGGLSMPAFMKACERKRRVSIRIPDVLYEYLQAEAERLGMRPGELMTTILETHQFKDRDRQAILLAVDAARTTRRKRSRPTSRRKSQ
jgi:hypothetical protein